MEQVELYSVEMNHMEPFGLKWRIVDNRNSFALEHMRDLTLLEEHG